MFAAFSKVDLDIFGTYHQIEGIPFGRLPLGRILPRKTKERLWRRHGAFLFVRAVK